MTTPAEEWSAATSISHALMMRPAGPFAVLALTTLGLRALEATHNVPTIDPLLMIAALIGLPLLYLWTQIEKNARERIRDLMAIGAPVRARLFLRAQLIMLGLTVVLPAAIVAHDSGQWFAYLALFVLIAGLGSRGTGAVVVAGIVLGLAARYGVVAWLLAHLPLALLLALGATFGMSLLAQQIARIRRYEVWSALVVLPEREFELLADGTESSAEPATPSTGSAAPDAVDMRDAPGDIDRLDLRGRVDYVMGWPTIWPSRRAVVFYLFALPVFVLGARFVFGREDAAITLFAGLIAVTLVVAERLRRTLRGLIDSAPRYAALSMAPAMPDRITLTRAWLARSLARVAIDAALVGLGFALSAIVVREAPADMSLTRYLIEIGNYVLVVAQLSALLLLLAVSVRGGEALVLVLLVLIAPPYVCASYFEWLPWPLLRVVPGVIALLLALRLYRRGLALPYGAY